MGVKAMKLIDANAIVEKLQSYYEALSPDVYSELIRRDEVSSCIAELINAPTIDAQPVKHGHWVELPKALNSNENPCQCSNCKHVVSFYYGYPKSKFCDECGSKMDGDSYGNGND